jgi:hypothetical protein
MFPHPQSAKLGVRKNMMNNPNEHNQEDPVAQTSGAQRKYYELRVKGQLDASWSDWLDGLDVRLLDEGEMILSGYIGDQAALMGILNKLYGLNLTLLSVSEAGQKK